MREVLSELMRWWEAGETVGVGTVVGTWRSAPRPAGASMLVTQGGEAVGSVSGGCVEGALYELGPEVLATARPRTRRYGVSDDDAFAVGLTCGGILEVFVEKVSPRDVARAAGDRRRRRRRGAPSRSPPSSRTRTTWGVTSSSRPDAGVEGRARHLGGSTTPSAPTCSACWSRAPPGSCTTAPRASGSAPSCEVFVDVVRAAAPHVRLRGHRLLRGARPGRQAPRLPRHGRRRPRGLRDPQALPRRPTRWSCDWPHRWLASQTVDRARCICVLTHDPKFDVPALRGGAAPPRPPTSARWARGAPTRTG